MRKGAGKEVAKRILRRKNDTKRNVSAKPSGKSHETVKPQPSESLDSLLHQKEEIEALLSSLEDAYSEAAILEDDYNDIKSKNEKKLEEISRKIDIVSSRQIPKSEPAVKAPVISKLPVFEEEEAPAASEEKPAEKPKRGKIKVEGGIGAEDLEKLEVDLAGKIKEMVEEIGTKVTEKDLLEMKSNFAKYEAEIDKMKAQVEAVREGKRLDEEKSQRVIEGLAELRTMVYSKEASSKEQEIRVEKVMDMIGKLEPEKISLEIGRRDKEISNLGLRASKLEETTKEFGEILRRIETLLRNIGSLEHVIRISSEASEKLMSMEDIQRSNQKMLDKIQGIYAELSKRMEEFMLYRAKQDRLEDLLNESMKSLDELTTRSAYFVTKDDLESFRAGVQSSIQSAQAAAMVSSGSSGMDSEKEEIEMLLKTLEDEFRSKVISKGEYEKMKNANMAKLREIEEKAKKSPQITPVKESKQPPVQEKKPEKKPAEKPERKEKAKNDMLLKDLEDTFRKGLISKEAYEKTRKMILGKR